MRKLKHRILRKTKTTRSEKELVSSKLPEFENRSSRRRVGTLECLIGRTLIHRAQVVEVLRELPHRLGLGAHAPRAATALHLSHQLVSLHHHTTRILIAPREYDTKTQNPEPSIESQSQSSTKKYEMIGLGRDCERDCDCIGFIFSPKTQTQKIPCRAEAHVPGPSVVHIPRVLRVDKNQNTSNPPIK
jgi:hypothetical protein